MFAYRRKHLFIFEQTAITRREAGEEAIEALVGLLPTGHLPTIGTLMMPVKSIDLFKTLFFLTCVPGSMIFFGRNYSVLFVVVVVFVFRPGY